MKRIYILIFIVIIAAFLRLWNLGIVPPSPDWDEASLGYNAYSIMATGKDEYGTFLPVVLRSFDDYKPGLYTYFIIPFIKLFDVSIVSVRLPSVIIGILAVLGTFFLVKELFEKDSKYAETIGLISSFLLAISPWHLQFSRVAFEACSGMAFNLFTVLFFLKGMRNHIYLLFSVVIATLNIYLYQSNKVFTPLLFLLLIIFHIKTIVKIQKKYLLSLIVIGLLLLAPLVNYEMIHKSFFARAAGTSVFADITPFLKEDVQKLSIDKQNNDLVGMLLDNRRVVYLKAITAGYISHFDLNWLFINGDLARHHAPGMGLMYLFELPFLFIGLYHLVFGKYMQRIHKILFFMWFLIIPIPASVTSGVPHGVRTINFLPLLQIITATGFLSAFTSITKPYYRYVFLSILILFCVFNFTYFLNQYFVQQNYYYSQEWQYGYKQALDTVKQVENKYEKIVVSNKPHMDQSYIFFLFYLKYSPSEYQAHVNNASGGFREDHAFGKYEFRSLNWEKEIKSPKNLYIGRPEDFPESAHVIQVIPFLNGKPAIKIVEG